MLDPPSWAEFAASERDRQSLADAIFTATRRAALWTGLKRSLQRDLLSTNDDPRSLASIASRID